MTEKRATTTPIRAAIAGTGYIAEFHARAIQATRGVVLVGVCDTNVSAAQAFARTWNVPAAFDSLEAMLKEQRIDALHILVPPDLHHPLTSIALQSGVHVFLEKPMSVTVEEADDLLALAREKNLRLGVNHNMMYLPAYQRLREAVHSGAIGPIDHVAVNWFSELAQIRFGPFETWMLRAPAYVALETAPHLLSMLLDLGAKPDTISAVADREVALPNGARVLRRWRIGTTTGRLSASANMNFGPGFNERTVCVHGLTGTITADLNANTCAIDLRSALGVDFDRHKRSVDIARQLRSQARRTLASYVLSKLKLPRTGTPYQLSFMGSVSDFYAAIRDGIPLDRRIDGAFGRDVIDLCVKAVQAANADASPRPVDRKKVTPVLRPKVLVLGASGFIGREVARQLLLAGHAVRAMVRGSPALLEVLGSDRLQIVRGDARREADLRSAMDGIEHVFHLAVGQAKTWGDYRRNEVDSARLVGELCLAGGVKRLIYTGTIDSYYAGAKAGTITEATPLDPNIARRNYYARAKAAAEAALMEMHQNRKLPVAIFRPGIVIGRGGNPFHWGVGRFSENVCEVWGDGNNPLPFVLVEDVAAALVRGMDAPGIEGRSFNLIDSPLLSARDYLAELQKRSGLTLAVHHRPIWRFYLADLGKWIVKAAVGHPDRIRIPSYGDWESRTQKAHFDCTRARTELGWQPASDRGRLIEEGIGGALQEWLEAVR